MFASIFGKHSMEIVRTDLDISDVEGRNALGFDMDHAILPL